MPPNASVPEWVKVSIAGVGGFIAAFVGSMAGVLMNETSQKAQLLAGDPAVNREYPTMQNMVTDSNPMLSAMGSYVWWSVVAVLTLVFGWMLLKMVRRYV